MARSRKPAKRSPGKALEKALVENPDDVAAHAAYADGLMQQDDSRGEFIFEADPE